MSENDIPRPPMPPVAQPLATPATKSTLVTGQEIDIILDETLLKEHRYNPYVIKWIESFLNCQNNAQACREAGITLDSGTRLRRKRDIQEALKKIASTGVLKYGYDAEEIVQRVKEIVDLDPVELERPDGSYVNKLSEIRPEARRAIKSMKVKNLFETDPNGMKKVVGEVIEVIFYDKLRGAELLGREKDLFKQNVNVEHNVSKGMADVLLEARRRGEDAADATYREVGESDNNTK